MFKLITYKTSSDDSVQPIANDADATEKEKERKRQKALSDRQSQVQAQKHQLAQNIDRSRAGLEREGGEENFRYVPRLLCSYSGKYANDLS
jgi:transcription elongation regulator 1